MIIDIAPNEALELSLFIRAVLYCFGFILMGLWVLTANERVGRFERLLGLLLIVIGLFNGVMAAEWLYFFFFTEATLQ